MKKAIVVDAMIIAAASKIIDAIGHLQMAVDENVRDSAGFLIQDHIKQANGKMLLVFSGLLYAARLNEDDEETAVEQESSKP